MTRRPPLVFRSRLPSPGLFAWVFAAVVAAAWSAPPAAAQPPGDEASQELPQEEIWGYVPPENPPLLDIGGYIDVGFADVGGDGSSLSPRDHRLPADYGIDPFQTAVNSRGDVASVDADGMFTNGFRPQSVGIGGRPSFLLNTVNLDLTHGAPADPVLVFARVQMLPRLGQQGSETEVLVEQAFGRLTPWQSQELFVSVGKLDSVFGIEYLENQAPLRTGITPSLLARYTTGPSLGAKVFYRFQIAPLWSALSLNLAATTSGPFVASLQASEASLTGRPVATGRLGYELNLPSFQVKLGGSGLWGPRNDQGDDDARQEGYGVDARLYAFGLSLAAEYLVLDQDQGPAADKLTGQGPHFIASGFHVRGGWGQLTYSPPLPGGPRFQRVAAYLRVGHRRARFEGFPTVVVQRLTVGLRLDLWSALALKAELLFNREAEGAPPVDNDVRAASLVWTF